MADSQNTPDAATEKAFAEAAEKKAAEAHKPAADVKSASAAQAEAPVPIKKNKPVKKNRKATSAAHKKPVSTKPAAAKKMTRKSAAAKKPAQQKIAAAKQTQVQPALSQLKEKIMATAKTTDFNKTFTDAAAEMQSRVKAAYDKGAALAAEATEFHKGNFEAFVESGKLLSSGMQDFGRTAVEEIKTAAETATDDVKKMAAVKSPTELLHLQGEIARRNFEVFIAQSAKNAESMMKLANDVFAPLSNRASLAVERITKAA